MTARTLTISRTGIDPKPLLVTGAPEMAPNLSSTTLVVDAETDQVIVVVGRLPAELLGAYRRAALAYPPHTTVRGAGIRNESRTFGYVARNGILRRTACRVCGGSIDAPLEHALLAGTAGTLFGLLSELVPEQAEHDAALVLPEVSHEWRMHPDAPWTSGVLNFTSPLPYHFDRNNFDAWSAMVVLRRNISGGHLSIPEFGLVVECRDGDVVMFNGNRLLHGVTPMRKTKPDGYRLTAVYYPVKRMANCLPGGGVELARGRVSRSTAEDDMLTRGPLSPRQARPLTEVMAADTPDEEHLADLLEFARVEVTAADIEPWAEMLRALLKNGDVTEDEALWLVKLYNAYDSLGSAWSVFRRWPTPYDWHRAADAASARQYPCTQERRNLRGGKVLLHLASYVQHLGGTMTQAEWLSRPFRCDSPESDWLRLTAHVRDVWGVGRQTAFEWAEFAVKVAGLPASAPDADLWESSGPRRSLERLYGGGDVAGPEWLDARAEECRAFLADGGVPLPWVDFETVICDYNVMRDGRYYPGRHLAALKEEIEVDCPEADRPMLLAAFRSFVPEPWASIAPGIDKTKMPVYRDTGTMVSAP